VVLKGNAALGVLGGVFVDQVSDEVVVLHRFKLLLQEIYAVETVAVVDVTHTVEVTTFYQDAAFFIVGNATVYIGEGRHVLFYPIYSFIYFNIIKNRVIVNGALAKGFKLSAAVRYLGQVAETGTEIKFSYQPAEPEMTFVDRIESKQWLEMLLMLLYNKTFETLPVLVNKETKARQVTTLAAVVGGPQTAYLGAL